MFDCDGLYIAILQNYFRILSSFFDYNHICNRFKYKLYESFYNLIFFELKKSPRIFLFVILNFYFYFFL